MPSADLTCRLSSFIKNTSPWGPFSSVEEVANKGTLFPYYARFFEPDRHKKTLVALSRNHGNGIKVSMGLVANRFGATINFRSCSLCDAEDLQRHGCLILQRFHQLPGVAVCAKHKEPLRSHGLQSQRDYRQQLSINRLTDCATQASDQITVAALKLAQLSRDALESEVAPFSPELRVQTYLKGMKACGFVNRNRLHWDSLIAAIRSEYEDFNGLEFRGRLLSSTLHPLRWVHDLIRRPDRSLHPVCHLLLIGLLFKNYSGYLDAAAGHDLGAVIDMPETKSEISPRMTVWPSNFSTLIADNRLSCRAVAKQTGASVTTIVNRRRANGIPIAERRKFVTPELLDLSERLLSTGLPISSIVAFTGLSLSTVYRQLNTLPLVQEQRKNLQQDEMRRRHRAIWLDLQMHHRGVGIHQLRKISGATYAWLYRHDKTWMDCNSPTAASRASFKSNTRVDWTQRDHEFTQLVLAEAKRLKSENSQTRRTVTRLLRATGQSTVARINMHKLPQLTNMIRLLIESDEDFRLRRHADARKKIIADGIEEAKEWRVQRLAGLRPRKSEQQCSQANSS